MRRFSILSILFFAIFLVVNSCSCNKEDPDKEYSVRVNPATLVFPPEGGTQEVQIITESPTCKVNPSDSWMQLTSNGDILVVTVGVNTRSESREGTIQVTVEGGKAEVSVVQSGKSTRPADDPYPQASYGLDEDAIFVKSDYTKAISASDPAAKTFTVPASSVGNQKPEVGQKLIMNTPTDLFPSGLLAKVVSVNESGGNYQVKYEPIKLEEAFSDLNIDNAAIDLASHVKEVRDAKGNKVAFAATKASSKETYHLELPAASWPLDYAGLEIAPIFELDLTLYFQAIVANYKLYSLNFDTEVGIKVGATVACGFEGKAIDERVPLYEIICGAIPVGPILITPTIGIDALLEVSGKVSVEATVHYSASRRYGLHYDANTGWGPNDYSEQNKNGGFTVENVSPKVEGTVAYGYSIGPAIGIYVEAVQAGIGYDNKTKHTLSGSYDVLHGDASDYLNWNLVQHLQNAEYAITDVEAVSFNVTVLTREVFDKSTPDITNNETKWKVLPKLGAFPEFVRTDEGLELTVWVKNRNALGGSLTAQVAEHSKDLVNRKTMVFPDSRQLIESLNSEEKPDSVALKGFVHLDEEDPDLNYAEFFLDVTGYGRFNLGSYMQEFNDEQARTALQGILRDLYQGRSSEGNWDGCNWFEPDVSAYALKNVRVSRRGDQFFFKINIRPEWKMGTTVTVNDHSKNCPKFGGWEIIFEDGCTSDLSTLTVLDSHFQGYYISSPYNHVKNLTINSPVWTRFSDLGSGIVILDNLDLSRTPIENFENASGGISVNKKLVLKECPKLKTLSFKSLLPESFDVTGSTALEEVRLASVYPSNDYFNSKGSGTEKAHLYVENCTLGALSVPYNYKEIWVNGGTFDKVTVSGNTSVESINVKGAKGQEIEVKDCSKLITLACPDTGISKFTVSNLPAMGYISVEDNRKLLSVVPEVFDQIKDNGGSVSYDIRYEYEDDGSGTIQYTDNGFGFWYEGEPDCGYHGKEPPQENEDGYVTYSGDTPARAAFRKVIQDLYRCRKGEWEGCDWLEAKPLSEMKNITAPENASNNETYSVVIPEEWQLGADVVVKKHNKLPTEQYGGEAGHYEDWQLFIKGERSYNNFSISDPRCYLLQVPGEAKTFAVHSPSFFFNPRGDEPWKYRSHVIPSKIHTLDFRGSGGYDFDYKVDYEHTPKVFKLRRYDGKNLNQGLMLSIKYSDSTPMPIPEIIIGANDDGMEGGRWIRLYNMVLPYGDLPIKVEQMQSLELYGCVGDMVYMPDNIKYLAVGADYGGSVNQVPYASEASQVKEIKVLDNKAIVEISAGVQESVTVSGCPSLREAAFGPSPISRFQMDNVPALKYLNLKGCTQLTMEVPALFDQEGLTAEYEERYKYTYGNGPYTTEKGTKFDYTDRGYGFWYKGEPNRGYHKEPK